MKISRVAMDRKLFLSLGVGFCLTAVGAMAASAELNQQSPSPNGQGAQIKVQEHQPNVTVHEQQPTINVQQPKPQVTVTQPQPQVTVTQPKPQVQVQEAQPSVHVQQQGQPKVNVEQQGQPNITVQREQNAQSQQAQPGEQAQHSGAQQTLATMQSNQIVGKKLYDRNNNEVATIEKAQQGANGQIQAVEVDVGGFLGIGSKRVAVPVDDLQLNGDRIIANSLTADQIRNMPSASTQQSNR